MNIKAHGSNCGLFGGIVLNILKFIILLVTEEIHYKNHSHCPSQDLNRSYVRIITIWLLQMFYIYI